MLPQRTTQELKCLMLSIVTAQYMEVFTSGKPDNQGIETLHVNPRQTLGQATWVCVCCRFSIKKQTNTKTKQLFMLSTRREQKHFHFLDNLPVKWGILQWEREKWRLFCSLEMCEHGCSVLVLFPLCLQLEIELKIRQKEKWPFLFFFFFFSLNKWII